MDLPKVILSYSYLRLLLSLICIFIYLGLTQANESISSTFKRTEKSVWLNHGRVRRTSNYQGCTGNKMDFLLKRNKCFYDHACFEIFSDCCWDYVSKCGRQESKETKQSASMWKCIEVFGAPSAPHCHIVGPTGFWMISKCPANTSFDKLRGKCENAPSEFSYPVEDYIPIVGANSLMYRNKHCALCNGVENYTAWDIRVTAYVVPPEEFDLDSRLKFILANGGHINHVLPGEGQLRRYCYGRNYIDSCSSTNDTFYKACIEGPVEVVTRSNFVYFKNTECATCNGYSNLTGWGTAAACGPRVSEGFSIVFKLRNAGGPKTAVISKSCPDGTVYDTTLKFCREGYIMSSSGQLTNEFLILLWLKQHRDSREINSKLDDDLKSSLSLAISFEFSLLLNQISTITFHQQYRASDYFVATFRLTLTAFQSLLMANQHKSDFNITRENTAFVGLLNFTGNFTVVWEEYSFSVVNVISKQLSCYGEKQFQLREYKIVWENGSVIVNKTGKVLLLDDYTLVEENDGNITLCRKLILSDCKGGAYVPLNPDEYVIFPNLTVYHKATNNTFKFGEYLMSEKLNKRNVSKRTQNLWNSTISVCLPFKTTFRETETKYSTSYRLRILTIIGFSVSTLCHILLLITYGLFEELRAVPGLNLMNLSFSMCLSQVIWLIGTAHFQGTIVCEVLAILEHYLLQVSFLAMSIISHHTCHVLSQPFVGRTANTSWRRFIKYSAFLWLTPGVFVAICAVLDKTEVFLVDYGMNCWLGTANAKLYLFLLPLAVSLLYNIYKFIQTAVSLSRHAKDREILQRKEGKQNLLICTKLATLVGFPWLFAFIGVLFSDVEVFEYLFVLFVCLQGLYVGMAFLVNKKTLKLYKDRWNIGSRRNAPSAKTR
ncbi:G- coupled receptor Mth2 [Paramuricea clavata]|uniref:G- coupled receptor Mth2 n=1 Tax=Paramuricea clavata TaxID=317549 RepID=A0A7D9INE4_PARCT|nr:G- coupled receptor Mth2 [Paramuricea clavata]